MAQQLVFPFPDEEARGRLWRTFLPRREVLSDSDIDFVATSFKLSGGAIEKCCADAAGAATQLGHPVRRSDLVAALHAHYETRLTSGVHPGGIGAAFGRKQPS